MIMKKSQLILIALTIGYTLSSGSGIAQEKPNIVFIIIDDLGWKDVGYMESKYYETPNIDRLVRQGIIFTNAYANAANCAPTRACLLSGQYSPRHGVFTVGNSDRGESEKRRLIPVTNSKKISLEKVTIAEALKPAGYVSAAIGKWHVGHSPKEHGFDVGMDRPDIGYKGGHFNKDGEYLTDRLTDESVNFITENKDIPFFLYLAHHAVHTPIQAKNDIFAKFSNKETAGCHSNAKYAAMISTDFYPTFLELAGAKHPDNYPLDGKSIVRLLKGKKSIKRDAIFWHFPAYLQAYEGLQEESRDPPFRTRPVSVIRKGNWKLLMFHEEWVLDGGKDKIASNNSVELYNLKKDLGESKNLCNIRNKKRNKLLKDLLKWQQEINAPLPLQPNPDYNTKQIEP